MVILAFPGSDAGPLLFRPVDCYRAQFCRSKSNFMTVYEYRTMGPKFAHGTILEVILLKI